MRENIKYKSQSEKDPSHFLMFYFFFSTKQLESEYRGRSGKAGQMFIDERVESNIKGEYAIQLFTSGDSIKTIAP